MFIYPHLAKLKKLNIMAIVFGLISIIAGITAIVLTITATTLEHFPKDIIFLAIYFICFIIMLIIYKKIDVEEAKFRQGLAKRG